MESPDFGEWVKALRGSRSHEDIARHIRNQVSETGLKVHPSLIVKIEQGRVPSWPLLVAISHVFNTSLEKAVLKLAHSIQLPGGHKLAPERDLSRQASTGPSGVKDATGETHVAAAQTGPLESDPAVVTEFNGIADALVQAHTRLINAMERAGIPHDEDGRPETKAASRIRPRRQDRRRAAG